jgi:hypothetical protein
LVLLGQCSVWLGKSVYGSPCETCEAIDHRRDHKAADPPRNRVVLLCANDEKDDESNETQEHAKPMEASTNSFLACKKWLNAN